MAVILGDVYRETGKKYGLKLIAGESGLKAEMNWVYIAESYVGGGYLNGGELIITTGVLCRESPEWLYHFIESMIGEHTCGLILNIGRYVWPVHITKEVLELCEKNHYPLFTMPWETLLSDVTRDYYNRIFNDSQTNEAIRAAFLNLVHGRAMDAQISLLEEYGFPAQGHYRAVYVRCTLPETDRGHRRLAESHLRLLLSRRFRESGIAGHLCPADGYALIICHGTDLPDSWAESLADTLAAHFPKAVFFAGTGSLQDSLIRLPQSFFHAKAAADYAAALHAGTGKRSASFRKLGFYRILLSVSDRKVLRDYADDLLQPVLSRDPAHRSDYADTLREYLRQNGSIQAAAAALYCHRNTINKRIRALKEEFGFRLDDPRTRFELTAAFEILDFLRIFP